MIDNLSLKIVLRPLMIMGDPEGFIQLSSRAFLTLRPDDFQELILPLGQMWTMPITMYGKIDQPIETPR
jgi:hypothetical protein